MLSRWSFGCSLSQYLLQLVPPGMWENKTPNKHKKTRKHSVKIFPQTAGLGKGAVRHRAAQVFAFAHSLAWPQLEVKSVWFSLRCSERSSSTPSILRKSRGVSSSSWLCSWSPGEALCCPPAWPGSQRWLVSQSYLWLTGCGELLRNQGTARAGS